MPTDTLTPEEVQRAQEILEREERRKAQQREYRERRKDNPEVVEKQKAYNQKRRHSEALKKQAYKILADRHSDEFAEILAGMNSH